MLSITIHVHEQLGELQQLLKSLQFTSCTYECPILIVNNSRKTNTRKLISEHIKKQKFKFIREVNQWNWLSIQSDLKQKNAPKSVVSFLAKMELGQQGWAVHQARNIGMIATKLLYPDITHTLHLDSDIILPRKELNINYDPNQSLSCFQISGSPDLSRLEWIELLCQYLAKKCNQPFSEAGTYVEKLATKYDASTLRALLGKYTDLLDPLNYKFEPLPNKIHPQREEFYGACYIAHTSHFSISPFAPWYDNDWCYFMMTRPQTDTVKFLDTHVVHAATKKNICCSQYLKNEELGKMLFRASLRGSNSSSCHEAKDFRYHEVIRIARMAEILYKENLHEQARSQEISYIIKNIYHGLNKLAEWCKDISINSALQSLNRFEEERLEWHQIFDFLSSI